MSTYGLWLSAAGMKINEFKQTIHAHNLANAETTGFKHDLAIVGRRLVASREIAGGQAFAHPVLDGQTGGANVLPTYTTFGQGSIDRTGRALDVAIEGDGFFEVSDGALTRYTRDGAFTTNRSGELVLSAGAGRWRVLDEDGAPIVYDETAGPLTISGNGHVRQGDQVIGTIRISTTDDKTALRKTGENLFDASAADMKSLAARLVPESREASTYDVMEGLTTMIEATRAYQLNATMIQIQDQMTGVAVTAVGRTA